jgi:hypothetical protein
MTYGEHFGYWIVVRHLPNSHRLVLGRYRKRADADGHLALLRMLTPRGSFAIAYDAPIIQPQN